VKNLPIGLKILIIVALAAVVIVVVQEQRAAAREAGWEALAAASNAGNTIESLESAAQATKDTAAEPWAAFQLARKLYDQGGTAQFERARLVAQQALDRYPDHAAAAHLARIIAAVDSLTRLAPG
jgi:tetratricopeptide (TPR) repeat protein